MSRSMLTRLTIHITSGKMKSCTLILLLAFHLHAEAFSYNRPISLKSVGHGGEDQELAENNVDHAPRDSAELRIEEAVIREEEQSPLSDEDYKRAGGLQEQDVFPTDGGLALYSADYFEGDIIGSLAGRNAVRDKTVLWPNGRIPYVLSRKYSARDRAVLAAAMKGYADSTCIRFEPKTASDYNFIYIYPGNGCASQVGKGGGMQLVSLGVGCIYVGISQHELMHVVGFWHEQSRYDRDDYIRINWENIEPGMEYNFDKYSWDDIQSLDAPYDYGSVMHYGTHAFAKSYGPTISSRNPTASIIGQRQGLSSLDIEKINRLYECKEYLTKSNYTLNFTQNNSVGG